MSDDEKQVEEVEPKSDPKPKTKSKRGTASASPTHYVAQNIENFAKRQPDMASSAKSVFKDHHLDNEHLNAVLNRDLPPELNHFIRWLLKIPYAERTEWLNK